MGKKPSSTDPGPGRKDPPTVFLIPSLTQALSVYGANPGERRKLYQMTEIKSKRGSRNSTTATSELTSVTTVRSVRSSSRCARRWDFVRRVVTTRTMVFLRRLMERLLSDCQATRRKGKTLGRTERRETPASSFRCTTCNTERRLSRSKSSSIRKTSSMPTVRRLSRRS